MNTLREEPRDDRAQRLGYPTLEQLGRSTPLGEGRSSSLAFLIPAGENQIEEKEAAAAQKIAALEAQLANLESQMVLTAERSRLHGEETGRAKAAEEFGQALAQSRRDVAASLEAFARERQDYFRRVESEVVKLAMAIARKVLHREAQMDSMLLSGAVRSALDRLEGSTGVVLRVPLAEGDGWKSVLGNLPQSKRPRLEEDAQLRAGDCVLESQMGTIELSVGAQLEEIDRGFFDLLRENNQEEKRTADGGKTLSATF